MTTPEAGWYVDPAASDLLRLWDGSAWTDETRPRTTVDGASSSGTPSAYLPVLVAPSGRDGLPVVRTPDARRGPLEPTAADRRRRRLGIGAGVGALLVAGLLGATQLPSGKGSGSSTSGSQTPAAKGQAAASTKLSTDCRDVERRPGPRRVVGWLALKGVPSTVSATAPPARPDTCASVAFVDARAAGTNLLYTYPTAAAAAKAAHAEAGGNRIPIQEAHYLVELDRGLRDQQDEYRTKLADLVARTNPTVASQGSASMTASSTPSS